jgi:hypothetical protein
MAILRGPLSSDGWTPVPNHWTRNAALSWKAKGLLAYIAGHAAGYELLVAQIVDDGTEGKDAVQSGLEELEHAGYLRRTRRRNGDGTWGSYDYVLTERPNDEQLRATGRDQGGSNQGGKSRTGSDQQEHDVSPGQNQSGSAAPDNPPAKKTTSEKTREDHPPGDAAEKEAPEINAGSIVADWIDYCSGREIKLTKQAIGRYAKKIKELLDEGFQPKLIKHALSLQLERKKAAYPGMLDAFIVEVQGGRPADAPARRAPAYQSAAEKDETRRTEEAEVARIADELAAQYGTDPKDPVANLKISKQARQIYESRSTTCQPTGYSERDKQDVVDAEWTEHPTDTPREVTAA